MPRKFFRKYLPSHESVRENRYFSRFGRFLHHPNLWHLNRHSVAGGVAVGLFAGLVPGPLQMLTAAILAVPLRVNLPVALLMTLYTNPVTIGPLYVLAFGIGSLLLEDGNGFTTPPAFDFMQFSESVEIYLRWVLSLGKPLFVGLVALAVLLGVLGYFAVQAGWRLHVVHSWRRRARERRARPNRPLQP
ncbi:MAG: DUF2062 domain-containing protein [Betaproteobacteria bacterium]|nr:DUF2062 domain-containing protein [Betaproteobacteria bacterium]